MIRISWRSSVSFVPRSNPTLQDRLRIEIIGPCVHIPRTYISYTASEYESSTLNNWIVLWAGSECARGWIARVQRIQDRSRIDRGVEPCLIKISSGTIRWKRVRAIFCVRTCTGYRWGRSSSLPLLFLSLSRETTRKLRIIRGHINASCDFRSLRRNIRSVPVDGSGWQT